MMEWLKANGVYTAAVVGVILYLYHHGSLDGFGFQGPKQQPAPGGTVTPTKQG